MTAAERLAFAQGALDGPAAKKPRLEGAEEEEEELPEFDFEKALKNVPKRIKKDQTCV